MTNVLVQLAAATHLIIGDSDVQLILPNTRLEDCPIYEKEGEEHGHGYDLVIDAIERGGWTPTVDLADFSIPLSSISYRRTADTMEGIAVRKASLKNTLSALRSTDTLCEAVRAKFEDENADLFARRAQLSDLAKGQEAELRRAALSFIADVTRSSPSE